MTAFTESVHAAAHSPTAPSPAQSTEWFVEILRRWIAPTVTEVLPSHAAISLNRRELFLIDVSRNRAIVGAAGPSAIAVLKHALVTNPRALAIESISVGRFERVSRCYASVPLLPMLWRAIMEDRGYSEHPLAPLTARTRLKLSRWPDFRVLAHRHEDFRLCSLILKRPFTVAECSALLDIEPAHVQAFFNAAYFTGYASQVEETPSPPAGPPHRPRRGNPAAAALLARMWRIMRTPIGS